LKPQRTLSQTLFFFSYAMIESYHMHMPRGCYAMIEAENSGLQSNLAIN